MPVKPEHPVLRLMSEADFTGGDVIIRSDDEFLDAMRENLIGPIKHKFPKEAPELVDLLYAHNFVVVLGYRDKVLHGKVITILQETEWTGMDPEIDDEDFVNAYETGIPVSEAIAESKRYFRILA